MLSIDRMENHSHIRRRYPRYHSSLFRGQPAWDPHTHVVLPLSVLNPPKAEGEHHLGNSVGGHGKEGVPLLRPGSVRGPQVTLESSELLTSPHPKGSW